MVAVWVLTFSEHETVEVAEEEEEEEAPESKKKHSKSKTTGWVLTTIPVRVRAPQER